MKKMLCLAVFALGLATPAVAEDWVWLGNNSDNTITIFGDADSRTDNSAWFEHRYANPKKHINENFLIQLESWKKWIAVVNVLGL